MLPGACQESRRKQRICVVTDGGHQMGMGHVLQSTTLAKALAPAAELSFLTKSDAQIVAAIREAGFAVTVHRDDTEIFAHLRQYAPDVVLFDKIDVDVQLARRIRTELTARLVIFTNLTGANDYAHMVVLQRAADLRTDAVNRLRNESYTDPRTGTRYFYGPRYWVLRPEFHAYRKRGKRRPAQTNRILLAFGGSDPTNLSSMVLDKLLRDPSAYAIDLILGPQFNQCAAVESVLDMHRDRRGAVSVYRNASNVAELMYAADLAITAAGMSMFETLCVGTPVIVIPQDQLQRDTYQGLMRLLEVDELDVLGSVIKNSDFTCPEDPVIAAMEIGDGIQDLIESVLTG